MSGIRIDSLGKEIAKMMEEYASEVAADIKAEARAVAKETVKELKKTSPDGPGSRKGHYKDGWASKVETENAVSIGIQIYNKKKPGLTHLLEKGHAKRNGGRVDGIPHIKIAEKHAKEILQERIERYL